MTQTSKFPTTMHGRWRWSSYFYIHNSCPFGPSPIVFFYCFHFQVREYIFFLLSFWYIKLNKLGPIREGERNSFLIRPVKNFINWNNIIFWFVEMLTKIVNTLNYLIIFFEFDWVQIWYVQSIVICCHSLYKKIYPGYWSI